MSYVKLPEIPSSSPSENRGQIQVIFGPMFSGKSTELMRRVRRFQIAQYKCIVIKYAKDTRYSKENLATHDRPEIMNLQQEQKAQIKDLAKAKW